MIDVVNWCWPIHAIFPNIKERYQRYNPATIDLSMRVIKRDSSPFVHWIIGKNNTFAWGWDFGHHFLSEAILSSLKVFRKVPLIQRVKRCPKKHPFLLGFLSYCWASWNMPALELPNPQLILHPHQNCLPHWRMPPSIAQIPKRITARSRLCESMDLRLCTVIWKF